MFKLATLVFGSLDSKVGVKVYFSGSCVNNNHYKTSCNRIPFYKTIAMNSKSFEMVFAFFSSEKTLITSSPKSSLSTLSCWTGLQVIFHHLEGKKWFVNITFAHCHLNASFKQNIENNIFSRKKWQIFFVRLISKRRALLMKKLYPSVASKLP